MFKEFNEDKARSVILEEAPRFGVATECYQAFSDYVLNQQRDAWIRGKEYGWEKAWKWAKWYFDGRRFPWT